MNISQVDDLHWNRSGVAVSFILQFYNEKESYKLNLEIGYGIVQSF
ncbi:hypothetical protein LEP1GSC088_4586 [Leptospira interrogans str. L1207]|nr:hypothetical protein LEP1GSC088_4586 [Leptospira interrogans str. L1207]